MKTITHKGLTIIYRRNLAVVVFGGRNWEFKTLQRAKSFAEAVTA